MTLERPDRGTNSDVWRVTSPHGAWFLRRVADERRWAREQSIRAALNEASLPFAVPRTIVTLTGVPAAHIDGFRYELTECIPGRPPRYGDLDDAHACGAALAALDRALTDLDNAPPARAGDDGTAFADLTVLSAAFPDHPDIPAANEALQRIGAEWTAVALHLPRQLVHADPYPSNMLMVNGQVSGILDFEFCSVDARVVDLAAALSAFAMQNPDRYDPWPVVNALSAGYLPIVPLSDAEVGAVPLAIMRREALSLTHWSGLMLRGHREAVDQSWRPTRLVDVQRWTSENPARIIETIAR